MHIPWAWPLPEEWCSFFSGTSLTLNSFICYQFSVSWFLVIQALFSLVPLLAQNLKKVKLLWLCCVSIFPSSFFNSERLWQLNKDFKNKRVHAICPTQDSRQRTKSIIPKWLEKPSCQLFMDVREPTCKRCLVNTLIRGKALIRAFNQSQEANLRKWGIISCGSWNYLFNIADGDKTHGLHREEHRSNQTWALWKTSYFCLCWCGRLSTFMIHKHEWITWSAQFNLPQYFQLTKLLKLFNTEKISCNFGFQGNIWDWFWMYIKYFIIN